ncbi:PREDICTED: uncharacterized protein LOC109163465 [Ipomoea nil]|uniref:uncharacterized protein LOC109163465 n=1 Tax=Ipomoea nil TaxID=35883 RepID=UPI000901F004|nr:PREDICTED: uncharacterized protein LOC109163465 [Ipomoea nil]
MAEATLSATVRPSSIFLKSQILRNHSWHRCFTLAARNAIPISGRRHLHPFLQPPRFCLLFLHTLPLRPRLHLPLLHRFRAPPLSSPMSSLPHSSSSPNTKTVRAVIKGRVQGVFYRDWTVENAKELGLKGWVRNRRDGTVEALFSGSPEKVEEMEQRCRRGPPSAMVTGLDVFPCNDDPGAGFERRSTA